MTSSIHASYVVQGADPLQNHYCQAKMAESEGKSKRDELATFEIENVDLRQLTDENCVGRGSYGAVYRLTVDGVPRIAKRIHNVLVSSDISPSDKQAVREKFYDECLFMSKLDHPNIVGFIGVHFKPSDRSDVTLIMECLHTPLETFLSPEKHPNIPISVKVHILGDVSCGLLYLHTQLEKRLIHRDLTVTNILLTRDLRAKIADLGVSKVLSDSVSQRDSVQTMCPGNNFYMPPEAMREDAKYDTHLDIFSFGHMTLYVEIQQFPAVLDVLHSEGMERAAGSGELEILRRRKWIDMVSHDGLRDVILQCLRDRPDERPNTKKLNSTMKTLCAMHPKSADDVVNAWGEGTQIQVTAEKNEIEELTKKVNELGLELGKKEARIKELERLLRIGDSQKKYANYMLIESSSKTVEELRVRVKRLTFENEQKDALIRILKQKHHWNEQEIPDGNEMGTGKESLKEHTVNLDWMLERKPCGELLVLGNGSYGKVYKGCCRNTGKHLAVKVVLDLTQKAADDLEKEVKQLSELSPHRRVVTYLGACYAEHPRFREKCLYVFTEFMPGGSLASCLKERGPLTQALTRRYTRQILEGVEYLHQCKIIHRDIKGSNIMCDTRGNVKLADFGSAKQICSETLDKDKTKYLCGTAPWAAPEVLRGEKARTQSDIWSVAATVVEMLTGAIPYGAEKFDNSMAIIFQVGGNKLNPLKSMKRGGHGKLLTDDTETFLSKCFKSDAKDRPSATVLLSNFPFCKQ